MQVFSTVKKWWWLMIVVAASLFIVVAIWQSQRQVKRLKEQLDNPVAPGTTHKLGYIQKNAYAIRN